MRNIIETSFGYRIPTGVRSVSMQFRVQLKEMMQNLAKDVSRVCVLTLYSSEYSTYPSNM